MFNTNQLDSITKKLCSALPQSLKQAEADIHETFKSILQAGFSQLDVVTREEFDAQVNVLARTREKVEALQKQLDACVSIDNPKP
jgi:ubiquinone biosynthesis accessory factor UbiK